MRYGALLALLVGCASTPAADVMDQAKSPNSGSSGKSTGPTIDATVMVAGLGETKAIGASGAHMVDAWACEAAERYDQRMQIRCKDDVEAILQVKAMQASFAMESGEDMDTEAMVKLMKASHFMAISIDKQDDGDLAVTVLLADEIGRPVHKLSESAAGLEAVEPIIMKGVKEAFEVLAQTQAAGGNAGD
ncbi:MAG TPA: hypothetical protein DEB46_12540 [Myxococcales bacterium]|nr:hypothetical protein [Myxococcales bacterium]HBU49128.1 hypothetical protein [Myxococcales bacterium]|tara:strand:- start:312 stop:881 length:570 start_codon:yes stop_codon:yes gene_type:complete